MVEGAEAGLECVKCSGGFERGFHLSGWDVSLFFFFFFKKKKASFSGILLTYNTSPWRQNSAENMGPSSIFI